MFSIPLPMFAEAGSELLTRLKTWGVFFGRRLVTGSSCNLLWFLRDNLDFGAGKGLPYI